MELLGEMELTTKTQRHKDGKISTGDNRGNREKKPCRTFVCPNSSAVPPLRIPHSPFASFRVPSCLVRTSHFIVEFLGPRVYVLGMSRTLEKRVQELEQKLAELTTGFHRAQAAKKALAADVRAVAGRRGFQGDDEIGTGVSPKP